MTIREMRIYPDPILREKSVAVTEFNSELNALLDDMRETMYQADGIGLAAPQIGVLKRIIVIDLSGDDSSYLEVINPTITAASGAIASEEGCLSIPDYRDTIQRSETVVVQAVNRHGEPITISGDGLLGRCLQHEIDHLNGVLFIDHLSRLKRELFHRWLRKHSKA